MTATPLTIEGDRTMVLTDSSNSYRTPVQSEQDTGVSWPYREPLYPPSPQTRSHQSPRLALAISMI